MADNYLEKKMEELRSGKMGASASKHSVRPHNNTGYLNFPFSSKNIVVIAPYSSLAEEMVNFYRSIGCRVAVFGNASGDEDVKIQRSYHEQGVRVISTEISDGSVLYRNATDALFSDWKRIDIILDFSNFHESINNATSDSTLSIISEADIFSKDVEDYNCSHPAPADYQQRLIRISQHQENLGNKILLKLTGRTIHSFTEMIIYYKEGYGANAKFKQNLMFLSLPQAAEILHIK